MRSRAAPAATALLVAAFVGCGRRPPPAPVLPALVVGKKGREPGEFWQPRAIAIDLDGGFYVADRTGRIQRFDGAGGLTAAWTMPDSVAGQPVGIAVDADGSVLVSDSHYQRILRFRPDGSEILARWGGLGTGPGQFTTGRGLVVDSEGFIYAGDSGGGNDRIQKFDRSGGFVLEWGRRGEGPGEFRRPQGMAVERRGKEEFILVTDAVNHRVQRFTRDGKWVASFGRLGLGPGELRYPYGVAVGDDGTIYVCEWGNHRIQRFDAEGRSLGVLGEPGHGEACLAHPWDVAVAPGGLLVVADCDNHRIQVFRWPANRGVEAVAPPGEQGEGRDA